MGVTTRWCRKCGHIFHFDDDYYCAYCQYLRVIGLLIIDGKRARKRRTHL